MFHRPPCADGYVGPGLSLCTRFVARHGRPLPLRPPSNAAIRLQLVDDRLHDGAITANSASRLAVLNLVLHPPDLT